MFLHQDGVILCATVRSLEEVGVIEPSLADERSLAELYPAVTPSGFGYLRTAIRSLASQGWLAAEPTLHPETTVLRWTEAGRIAARHRDRYVALARFLAGFDSTALDAWSRPWEAAQTERFGELVEEACARWDLEPGIPADSADVIATHLDGALAVPAMLWLRGANMLPEEGPVLPDGDAGAAFARLLETLGWRDPGHGAWTATGREARGFAAHLGLVGSYLPLLARLTDLFRGARTVVRTQPAGSPEWHVHRPLNILASGAAHRRYFDDSDGIFLEVFDREPVEAQPRFIADMGCGDGTWLAHLHGLIAERTLRGASLRSAPLLMVGIDSNTTALDQARPKLEAAGVPALLICGDITDPEQVRATLDEHGLAMEDGLHIRAFLDHNRAFRGADEDIPVAGLASGAYVDEESRPVSGAAVERDLVAHLRRWAPHVRKHGLVLLEAHCVAPRIARRHVGALHSVAFDAYHGYSHQYPVEHPIFVRCCEQAGFQPATHCERRYPTTRPFVAVSLNRLLTADAQSAIPALHRGAAREDTWQPGAETDLEDGRALHRLLYAGGDLRFPRTWCSAPTGFVVAGTLDAIEARLASAEAGDAIRVLDYGTGTGLAAIELLKACRQRGVEARLEQRGVTLEVHLADLPSSWFAQGFELLRECAWTRFHSLRGPDGGFRPLAEVTGGVPIDAVMANMVFHLIPLPALERVAAELASVLASGGRLLWSSPDLGPPGRYAVLFHDANRRLRARWLELLSGAPSPGSASQRLREAVRTARAEEGPDVARDAQARADRRILPQAQAALDVQAALDPHFSADLELRTYEILVEEILETLLVPSNQGEYLPEIADRGLREDVIAELMLAEVLPVMQDEPAGTALGLNVQWTLGRCVK